VKMTESQSFLGSHNEKSESHKLKRESHTSIIIRLWSFKNELSHHTNWTRKE